MLKKFFSREGADIKLLFAVIITVIFGIFMINSATASMGSTKFVLVQSVAFIIGLTAALIITFMDYSVLKNFRFLAMGIGLALLVVVLIHGIGREDTGTQGWIDLGFVNIQPAEIAKVCFLVSFSAHVAKIKEDINSIPNILLLLLHLIIPVALILLQPDAGTAMVFVFMFILMVFFAGISYKYILTASGVGVAGALLAWFFFLKPYQKERIFSFLNPEADPLGSGYHIIQSKIAVGSGQLFGTGYKEGIQTQMAYLPEKQTDFIFSVICEELGFMGAVLVVALLFFIIFRMFINAHRARDTFGEMLCVGAGAMLFFHVVENIGMCINLLPITGIPLPFISYGGSNMITSMIAVGIVLSVSFHRRNNTFL